MERLQGWSRVSLTRLLLVPGALCSRVVMLPCEFAGGLFVSCFWNFVPCKTHTLLPLPLPPPPPPYTNTHSHLGSFINLHLLPGRPVNHTKLKTRVVVTKAGRLQTAPSPSWIARTNLAA